MINMDFPEKVSRADIRYVPLCKSMLEIMERTYATKEDRELLKQILDNYIEE